MTGSLSDIIYELKTSKGLSDELIEIVLQDSLKAAYKRKFGTDENASVILDTENNEVALFAKKTIVEKVEDETFEIELDQAREYETECEIGDQILIEFNPMDFSRTDITVANQKLQQRVREFEGNSLYSEFKSKEGEIVIGYYLREKNKNIIVDLGRGEGILPRRNQSSREMYQSGDRIKALVHEVKKQGNRFEVLLSRTHPEFIKKIFELEVPEVYDGTVEIVKIVREPGYRTKMAVKSNSSDVDPIGTCVGTKGVRINTVMLELDSERIDILKYDDDPLTFIHNALSPAEVRQVIITDYAKRTAIAVVDDDKLSIAIGKLGLNVRLANRLTDWSINIKTASEFQEMDGSEEFAKVFENIEVGVDEEVDVERIDELVDLGEATITKLTSGDLVYIEDLFKLSNNDFYEMGLEEAEVRKLREMLQGVTTSEETDQEYEEGPSEEEEDLKIDALPFNETVLEKFRNNNLGSLYDLINFYSENKLEEIAGLSEEDIVHIKQIIQENVELE